MLLHARGIEHHTKGVENCLAYINLVLATGRIGKPGCGYGTITGQGNGQGGREHGQRCNQLPGARDIENPAASPDSSPTSGESKNQNFHAPAMASTEMFDAIRTREKSEASCRSASTRWCPFRTRTDARGAGQTGVLWLHRFLPLGNGAARRRGPRRISAGRRRRHGHHGEGRCVRMQQAVTPPGNARVDWEISAISPRRFVPFEYFPTPASKTSSVSCATSPAERFATTAE